MLSKIQNWINALGVGLGTLAFFFVWALLTDKGGSSVVQIRWTATVA